MGRRLTTAGCRKDPGGERREGRTEECRGVYITPHSGGRVCVCARREGEYLRIIERRRVGNRNEDLLLLRLLLPLLVGTQSLNVVRINAGILSRWLLQIVVKNVTSAVAAQGKNKDDELVVFVISYHQTSNTRFSMVSSFSVETMGSEGREGISKGREGL